MNEIIHAGFESPGLSFLRDLMIDEFIDHIVENVEACSEAMEAAAMLETNALRGSIAGRGGECGSAEGPIAGAFIK